MAINEFLAAGPTPPQVLNDGVGALAAFHRRLLADDTLTKSDMRVIEHLARGYPYSTVDRARDDFIASAKEMGSEADDLTLDRLFSWYKGWLRIETGFLAGAWDSTSRSRTSPRPLNPRPNSAG